jgi:hypothetical protein
MSLVVPSYLQLFYKKIYLKVDYTYTMHLLNSFKNQIVHYMFRTSYGHHQVLYNYTVETAVLASSF